MNVNVDGAELFMRLCRLAKDSKVGVPAPSKDEFFDHDLFALENGWDCVSLQHRLAEYMAGEVSKCSSDKPRVNVKRTTHRNQRGTVRSFDEATGTGLLISNKFPADLPFSLSDLLGETADLFLPGAFVKFNANLVDDEWRAEEVQALTIVLNDNNKGNHIESITINNKQNAGNLKNQNLSRSERFHSKLDAVTEDSPAPMEVEEEIDQRNGDEMRSPSRRSGTMTIVESFCNETFSPPSGAQQDPIGDNPMMAGNDDAVADYSLEDLELSQSPARNVEEEEDDALETLDDLLEGGCTIGDNPNRLPPTEEGGTRKNDVKKSSNQNTNSSAEECYMTGKVLRIVDRKGMFGFFQPDDPAARARFGHEIFFHTEIKLLPRKYTERRDFRTIRGARGTVLKVEKKKDNWRCAELHLQLDGHRAPPPPPGFSTNDSSNQQQRRNRSRSPRNREQKNKREISGPHQPKNRQLESSTNVKNNSHTENGIGLDDNNLLVSNTNNIEEAAGEEVLQLPNFDPSKIKATVCRFWADKGYGLATNESIQTRFRADSIIFFLDDLPTDVSARSKLCYEGASIQYDCVDIDPVTGEMSLAGAEVCSASEAVGEPRDSGAATENVQTQKVAENNSKKTQRKALKGSFSLAKEAEKQQQQKKNSFSENNSSSVKGSQNNTAQQNKEFQVDILEPREKAKIKFWDAARDRGYLTSDPIQRNYKKDLFFDGSTSWQVLPSDLQSGVKKGMLVTIGAVERRGPGENSKALEIMLLEDENPVVGEKEVQKVAEERSCVEKQEDLLPLVPLEGVVVEWNKQREYGFIDSPTIQEILKVHRVYFNRDQILSNLTSSGEDAVQIGATAVFESLIPGEPGKGPKAQGVHLDATQASEKDTVALVASLKEATRLSKAQAAEARKSEKNLEKNRKRPLALGQGGDANVGNSSKNKNNDNGEQRRKRQRRDNNNSNDNNRTVRAEMTNTSRNSESDRKETNAFSQRGGASSSGARAGTTSSFTGYRPEGTAATSSTSNDTANNRGGSNSNNSSSHFKRSQPPARGHPHNGSNNTFRAGANTNTQQPAYLGHNAPNNNSAGQGGRPTVSKVGSFGAAMRQQQQQQQPGQTTYGVSDAGASGNFGSPPGGMTGQPVNNQMRVPQIGSPHNMGGAYTLQPYDGYGSQQQLPQQGNNTAGGPTGAQKPQQGGPPARANHSGGSPASEPSCTLYVNNVPIENSRNGAKNAERDIRNAFEKFGKVMNVRMGPNSGTKHGAFGRCTVTFQFLDDAISAKQQMTRTWLPGHESAKGKKLIVGFHKTN